MTDAGWQRLHPRMPAVSLTWLLPPLGSTLLTLSLTGGRLDLAAIITLGSIALAFVIVAAVFAIRLLTTRFRITADRVELRSGLLVRRHRAVRRDRIRAVDVTANPMHRLLGLRIVEISAGSPVGGQSRRLSLDGVTGADAEALRRELAPSGARADRPLSALTWRGLWFAPLSLWGVGAVGVVAGSFARLLDSLRINPADVGFLRAVWSGLAGMPLWAAILVPVLVVLVLGALTSLGTFVETWWDYRLERVPGGAIRLRRGLFTTRSLWLEPRRIRGVQITEPLPLRLAAGARLNVIAAGLGKSGDRSTSTTSALLPPAPRAEVERIAAVVLGAEHGPLDLAPAPRAALRRRLTWCLGAVLVAEAPLVILGGLLTEVLLHIAWISGVALLPLAVATAITAYRNLGSGLVGDFVITRYGAYARRTVLLDRAGIVGWSVNQSVAQRRAGIATVVALVGAGRGGYKIRDVALADGVELARRATPGMAGAFRPDSPPVMKRTLGVS